MARRGRTGSNFFIQLTKSQTIRHPERGYGLLSASSHGTLERADYNNMSWSETEFLLPLVGSYFGPQIATSAIFEA